MASSTLVDEIKPGHDACLLAAAMLGQVEQIESALASGADVGRAKTIRGESALALAAGRGSRECVDALLRHGARDGKCSAGSTALMAAAAGGHAECIRSLLSVSNARARDADGWTALHYAASDGDAESVGVLLPVSDPGDLDDRGESALTIAGKMGRQAAYEAIQQYALACSERSAFVACADAGLGAGESRRL